MNAKQKKEIVIQSYTLAWQREVLVRDWHKFQEVIMQLLIRFSLL